MEAPLLSCPPSSPSPPFTLSVVSTITWSGRGQKQPPHSDRGYPPGGTKACQKPKLKNFIFRFSLSLSPWRSAQLRALRLPLRPGGLRAAARCTHLRQLSPCLARAGLPPWQASESCRRSPLPIWRWERALVRFLAVWPGGSGPSPRAATRLLQRLSLQRSCSPKTWRGVVFLGTPPFATTFLLCSGLRSEHKPSTRCRCCNVAADLACRAQAPSSPSSRQALRGPPSRRSSPSRSACTGRGSRSSSPTTAPSWRRTSRELSAGAGLRGVTDALPCATGTTPSSPRTPPA